MTALFCLPGFAQTVIPGGNIINQTWTAAGSPYTIQGDITIPAGSTLTIQAGTTVEAATTDASGSGQNTSRVEIIVEGNLVVQGTDASPVTFESASTSIGSWVGIRGESGGVADIDGAVIREATYGFDASAGTHSIDGSTMTQNSYGVYVRNSAELNVGSSLLVNNNSYGAYVLNSAVLNVDKSTVYGNFDGFYTSGGTTTITNSIISGNSDDGIDRNSGGVTVSDSNVWGNNGSNFEGTSITQTNVISANPLYNNTTELRLTSNSPSRFGSSDTSDQGARPYTSDATPGLYGTLWVDTTAPAGNTPVAGDLTIPPGVTLTIPAGATLTFQTSDIMQAYENTSRAELRVLGSIVTQGTTASPVTFTSATTSIGSWYGVHFITGATGSDIDGLIVERATYGFQVDATAPGTFNNVTMRQNSYGVYTRNSGAITLTDSLLLNNNSYGAYVLNSSSLTLDNCTVYGNFDGIYTSGGTTIVNDSIIANNSDDGIDRNSGSVTISDSTVWGNNGSNFEGTSISQSNVIVANPLFVSGSNLRLTSNSPSRFGAGNGSDQGALPYVNDATPGLYGTLWTDTTVPAGSTNVAGDLTVATGVTLTLQAGASLVFQSSDIMQAYENTSRAELRVLGSLVTQGTLSSPVTLGSATTSIGSWYGVTFYSGASGSSLIGVVIERATYGIENRANNPGVFDRLTLRSNSYGIYSRDSSQATLSNVLLFQNNSYGAYVLNSSSLTLQHATIYGNFDGIYTSGGTTTVVNSIITDNSDDGIDRNSGSVSISYSNVWGNNGSDFEGTSITQGAGMLSTNPFYAGAPNDLRLTSTSACVDSGTDASVTVDRDGATRPIDGDMINGPGFDMGAYEFAPVTVCGDGIIGAGESCDDGSNNGQYGFCNSGCSGPGPFCGDGTMNGPEQCDDGNGDNTDSCLSTCQNASCGDGFIQNGVEECDDANGDNTDSCAQCMNAVCGDGYVLAGVEDCDDSNMDNTDSCVACADATCGDGFVQAGVEECDDANASNTDACTNACLDAVCGDGYVGPGETCDDGDTINDNACSNTCNPASCGDGIPQTAEGEECDDGNMVNDDMCTNACRNPICGDGIVQTGEECDDGNMVNDDTCSNACQNAECGDGILQAGEECDDGNTDPTDACTSACVEASCGDGFVWTGMEECDDGNAFNDDSCVAGCVTAVCGDGFLRDGVEACDDGNMIDGDGCSAICALASCGDGQTQAGEECDDGNASNTDGCLNTCLSARCGDGFVRAGAEACDDGNDLDNDACLSTCQNASCGDGFVQAGVEACDDGNGIATDECLPTCEEPFCGDGFVRDGVEECDDGNVEAGDGCSAMCTGIQPTNNNTDPDMGSNNGNPDLGGDDMGNTGGSNSGVEDEGCGCSASPVESPPASFLILLAVFGLVRLRRRR